MKNWLLTLDRSLPHWFESAGMQWTQWVYALWQIFRCNPIVILLLSWPFYLWHLHSKSKIVMFGDSDDFPSQWEGDVDVDLNGLQKLEIIREQGKFCMARYGKYYYVAETSNVKKFAACLKDLGEGNITFVERPLTITYSVDVAKKISEREAAQRMFSSNNGRLFVCHASYYTVPTCIDYVELSSKLWGVLSSIPILLQARSYNRLSALLSLLIILLDLNRGWLYNLYDSLFKSFTKYVKLNLFKRRRNLYLIFNIFSSRWGYCDLYEGRAYIKNQDEELNVRYAELESQDDLVIVGEGKCDESFDWDRFYVAKKNYYVEIVKDRAHWKRRAGMEYAQTITGRPFYVSDQSVDSTLHRGKGSKGKKKLGSGTFMQGR